MATLRARTIVEAHMYLDLLRAEGALGDDDPGDPGGWTTLTEGPTGWTLYADGAGGRFRPFGIEIAYQDLAEARRLGSRFGPKVSTLIDAGQWREAAHVYAEQAIEAELDAAGSSDRQAIDEAVQAWQFAIDVAAEPLKFLPAGADRLPPSAFWTVPGRRAYEADLENFTRESLTHHVTTYRRLLDDFRAQMGP